MIFCGTHGRGEWFKLSVLLAESRHGVLGGSWRSPVHVNESFARPRGWCCYIFNYRFQKFSFLVALLYVCASLLMILRVRCGVWEHACVESTVWQEFVYGLKLCMPQLKVQFLCILYSCFAVFSCSGILKWSFLPSEYWLLVNWLSPLLASKSLVWLF